MTLEQPEIVEVTKAPEAETVLNKVFVGNLSLGHTQAQLRELFTPAGQITKVKLMSRNKKHFAYAFIMFEAEEEATKAVELFNGQDFEGRPLKVEIATNKERPKAPRKNKKRNSKKAGDKSPKGESVNEEEVTEAKNGVPDNTRRNTKAETKSNSENKDRSNSDNEEQPKETLPNNRRRGRGRGPPRVRRKRPVSNGEPSLTTLYVSNLPFNLSDEGLEQVFSSFKVKSAHVVRNAPSGRSKGFGFIEFESNEEQQRVLSEIGIVEINGRVLNVSVALSKPFVPSEDNVEIEETIGALEAQEPVKVEALTS